MARRGSSDGKSVRGRRKFRKTTLMGTYNVAGPNFGRKDPFEQATFEETTLMGTYNVAGPNFGRKDPSELAGASLQETTLMGTYNVAGPNFGRKNPSEQAARGRHTWQGKEGKSMRATRRFRRNHPYGNL